MVAYTIRALLACSVIAGVLAAEEPLVLHEGTPVRMKINRTISSADASTGETLDFSTLDDVKVGDLIAIPRGSTAIATVTEAEPRRRMGRGGKLNVNIDYVRLPNGDKLALRGVQDAKGGGHTGAMTGAMVATSIVFFPAAPLFLFMKGKDITIPEGHEVTVYTNTEYTLRGTAGRTMASGAETSVAKSGPAMTNADVLKLKQAGLSDDLVMHKIMSSPGAYKTDTDEILALKKAGLSDKIIGAMITASSGK